MTSKTTSTNWTPHYFTGMPDQRCDRCHQPRDEHTQSGSLYFCSTDPDSARTAQVTAGFVEWEDFPGLAGRKFSAPDGIATVTDERTPGGLYIIKRGNGSRQGMRPAFVKAALERSEVKRPSRSDEGCICEMGDAVEYHGHRSHCPATT